MRRSTLSSLGPSPHRAKPARFDLGKLQAGLYLNDVAQPPIALTFSEGGMPGGVTLTAGRYGDRRPAGEVDYGRIQFGQPGRVRQRGPGDDWQ